jgi:hypothetical protein
MKGTKIVFLRALCVLRGKFSGSSCRGNNSGGENGKVLPMKWGMPLSFRTIQEFDTDIFHGNFQSIVSAWDFEKRTRKPQKKPKRRTLQAL